MTEFVSVGAGGDLALPHSTSRMRRSTGLSGAVFGASAADALVFAPRMRAGAISINDAALTALIHDGEKHSFGRSGLGDSRMGPAALRRFGRTQAYLVADGSEPDPWWYQSLR